MHQNTCIVVGLVIVLIMVLIILSSGTEGFDSNGQEHKKKGKHYIVYKNLESPSNNMIVDKKLGSPSPLSESYEVKKHWCDKHKKCHGFNTAGFMKKEIVYPMVPAPGSEMYVKARYAQTQPMPDITNFTFHQGMDSGGNDIHQSPELANDPLKLASHCQTLPNCKGFNTNGWIKHTISPQANWYRWTNASATEANKGMFVHDQRKETSVPVAASITTVAATTAPAATIAQPVAPVSGKMQLVNYANQAAIQPVTSCPRCQWFSDVSGGWQDWPSASTQSQCNNLDSCCPSGWTCGHASGGGCYRWNTQC